MAKRKGADPTDDAGYLVGKKKAAKKTAKKKAAKKRTKKAAKKRV